MWFHCEYLGFMLHVLKESLNKLWCSGAGDAYVLPTLLDDVVDVSTCIMKLILLMVCMHA